MSGNIPIEAINTFVVCPVCKEPYDVNVHRPKILQCKRNSTHTICIICLKTLIRMCSDDDERDTFNCPICREEHQLPPSNIDANDHFIDNSDLFRLSDVLQDQSVQKDSSQIKCQFCDVANADWWCDNCSMGICKACRGIHDRLPMILHKLIPVLEVDWQNVKKKDFCKQHRKEIIKVCFCTTNKMSYLCKICTDDHKGHDFKDLITVATTRLSAVKKLYEKAVERNRQDLDCKQSLDATKKVLASNICAVESKLLACQDHHMKIMQMQHEKERKELSDIKENRTSFLDNESEKNEQRCCTFDNIRTKYEALLQTSSVNTLKDIDYVEDALNMYLTSMCRTAADTNAYLEILLFQNDSKFKEMLQETLKIKTMPNDLKVYIPDVAFQDHEFKLVIQTFSENRQICRVGGLPVKVFVESSCCDFKEMLYPLSSTGERGTPGMYVVPFVPKFKGECKLHVFAEEKSTTLRHSTRMSVHQIDISFNKVVLCDKLCEIYACFRDDIDPDVVERLNVLCQDEAGKILESEVTYRDSKKLIAKFKPNYLGKKNIFITVNNIKIAGPFVTAVWEECKGYLSDSQVNEITDIISEGNSPYFSYLTDDTGNTYPNMSFIGFDGETHFVLKNTVRQEKITSSENRLARKTDLTGLFSAGEKDYILNHVKNAAGFAISPCGEFAVSDYEEHCILIYRTPKHFGDSQKSLEPLRWIGEEGRQWGKFKNPTTLRINTDGSKLYVCDSGNGRIQELDMNGNPLNVFGPEILRLYTPEAISISLEGYLLILDKHKLVTFNVNSCTRRIIYQVEICCNESICNFNHLICCISQGKFVHLCRKNNSLRIFKYRPMEEVQV
ncbi:uncharacterized protein LOC117124579 [Anneissia japonica]|uniref:uncharacterized protein LOC117124579 n=1 Tax=Anneissia japonica TaxID=1529436 RepID=UPI0014257667|nr:uncharacterized protein LOC117124579 [Anneissia japonica]XP_033126757.1 uncharacterized protein LOC117124579 [Anneissia japonica]XP_033126758.1 uncharacterized protein LOC117124579 [Anneissia japonica]XP_033126760.1 uncharacterized protein LOC117124579 [Anneissia japonica]